MRDDFLEFIRSEQPRVDMDLVERAYNFAKRAHEGQVRESGDPYIVHPCEVAKIICSMGMDASTMAAGLLHDVVEDTITTKEGLAQDFGQEIADMVDGVTKISRLEFNSKEEQQAESLRKMLLAMAKDIRVVLIKLADRLHNMRTIGVCSPEKQARIARETLDIYAPLASRLGMYAIKWQLEDLSFKAINPIAYRDLEVLVAAHRREREELVSSTIAILKDKMAEGGIHCTIDGRPKHYYSIYKKMHDQDKTFDQIYDLTAVRIIVDSENDCYAALGLVHTLWRPIPGRVKDYIAVPKGNMYRSLHTTLVGPRGIPFEVQIRTWEMHRNAEYGIAAHWKYKEQRQDNSSMDEKLQWLRRVLEWQNETSDSLDFMNTLKVDLFTDEVFVFTPKGRVVELPSGANPIDFAYRIHSAVGNKCIGAKVNGRMVQLDVALQTGDIVEIITSNSAKGPSHDWLNLAKTPQARNKIRAWLKKERREENIEKGKSMFDAACKRIGIPASALLRTEWLTPLYEKYTLASLDDMYSAIGYGGIATGQVLTKLSDLYRAETRAKEEEEAEEIPVQRKSEHHSGTGGIIVKGQDGMLVRFARCCSPVPQDKIVGFITRGRGVSVHRADCSNLKDLEAHPDRFIEVEWVQDEKSSYMAELHLEAEDKVRLLVDIANIVQSMNARMMAINARLVRDNVAVIALTVEIHNKVQLENLIKQFKKMPEMMKVSRVNA